MGLEYKGDKADIFALGIIIFIMLTQTTPFKIATSDDALYSALVMKNFNAFWDIHLEEKPASFFSEEFKDLFQEMTELDPDARISLSEIKEHPWFKKESGTTFRHVRTQMKDR